MRRSNPEHWVRHPRFDEYWQEHQKLVWFFAKEMAIYFRMPNRDLVGTIVLLFNHALHTHDPSKGRLSTHLGHRLADCMRRLFLRYESELRATRYHASKTTEPDFKIDWVEHDLHMDLIHQDPVEPNDWADVFHFEEKVALLERLASTLPGKRFGPVLLRRYRDGRSLKDIAKEFNVTREQIRKDEFRAILMLQRRLRREMRFRHLFAGSPHD